VCALLVVVIHVKPLKSVDTQLNYFLVNYIPRIAVPFYFVSSGYFLFRKTKEAEFDRTVALSYVRRILRLYLIWTAIYLLPIIYVMIMNDELGIRHGIIIAVRDFLLKGSYFQLWYLNAVIVAVLLITCLLDRGVGIVKILAVATVLYAVGLLGQSYFGLLRPLKAYPQIWSALKLVREIIGTTRNGVFEGFLFMGLGALFAYRPVRMSPKIAVAGLLLSLLLLMEEVGYTWYYGLCLENDMYICLVPTAFFLFYVVSHIELKSSPVYLRLRAMGILVFYTHMWVDVVVGKVLWIIYSRMGYEKISSPVRFLVTLTLSLVLSAGIMKLSEDNRFGWLKKVY
jgi:serine/alanine racemase